jgi:hypothetical protein
VINLESLCERFSRTRSKPGRELFEFTLVISIDV